MNAPTPSPLERHLRAYDRVLEVGIGRHTALARRLAHRGVAVTAIDVDPVVVPRSVRFVRADVHEVAPSAVAPTDAVYGRHLPPELQRPVVDLGEALGADVLFTTLGTDPVLVAADRLGGPGTPVYRRPARRPQDV